MGHGNAAILGGRRSGDRRRIVLAMMVLLSILANQHLAAAILVFFDEDGSGDEPGGLYNFNTETEVVTLRATVPGDARFFAMDTKPRDMKVFACDPEGGYLWTIDIDTGVPTRIGPTGFSGNRYGPVGLAFHPTSGALFGLINAGGLYSVNTWTGRFTFIGDTGGLDRGLSFSPTGELFAFGHDGDLYSIDPATGNATPVGGAGNPVIGKSEDSTFTLSGELYATDYLGTIFRTDPITGDGVIVGTTGLGPGLLGLIEIPEPGTILLVGLGSLALLRTRRG